MNIGMARVIREEGRQVAIFAVLAVTNLSFEIIKMRHFVNTLCTKLTCESKRSTET
jgi:hypothetical protein